MAKKKKKGKKGRKKKDTRLDLLREQKILRAKEKVSGELDQRDAERLAWLDAELTKPPPLPADEKPTARMPVFKSKDSRTKASKTEATAEKGQRAQESPPAEEETLDEKAARKKRLAEARRKDQERKRQKELEQRVAEDERRRREAERGEEEEEPPPEEEEEPLPEEEEEPPPEEEEEPPPEEEEEPPPEEEEEPPPEEDEEPPPEEDEELFVAASDGWDEEDTDPGIALEADESSGREGDEEQATVEPDLDAHGEKPELQEPPPDAPAELRAVESEDELPDMSDDVPDMSDDVPDMSDDVPDMSDEAPGVSDDAPVLADEEATGVPTSDLEGSERAEANLAPPDEFDDLAGAGPAGILMQPTAIKPSEESVDEEPGASVMVDPTLFDDETKRGHPEAEVLAGLAREEKTPVPGLGEEEKTPVPGLGPSDELAAAIAAAEEGVAEEEDPAVAESLARAEAFERAQTGKKKTLKMKARAKPEPEPETEPGQAQEPLGGEPEAGDLDVGAALEAGAQAGIDPVQSGGLSESALFTESVVMDMSDITGAKAISLGSDKSGEDLKQNNLTGPRQAVVKMTTGLSRSGTVTDPDLSADELSFQTPGGQGDKPSAIPFKKIVIVQLMLPSGLARPLPTGAQVKVVLKDGTRLTGFSPDRSEGCKAFTLFPEKDRFIERVIVFSHAIKEVLTKG